MSRNGRATLGDLVTKAPVERAGDRPFTVLSMTRAKGLVPQEEVFKKVVASRDLSKYKIVRPNQLVVGIHIDEGALGFSGPKQTGIVSPAYALWDLRNPDRVHTPYLDSFIRSDQAVAYFISKYRQTAERRGKLTQDQFLALSIPLPPLAEQKQIAGILDAADALRAKRRETLAQLDTLLQSTFLDMFGDPVTNPMRWEQQTFDDAIVLIQYGPRFFNEKYTPTGVKIVRISDLDFGGRLDFDSMPLMAVTPEDRTKYSLQAGDLIVARTGATVGKTALMKKDDPECIAGAYFIRMQFAENVHPIYAQWVIRSNGVQSIIRQKSQQSAQPNCNGPTIRRLPLPTPPLKLQLRFAAIVESVELQEARMRAHLAELNVMFASLQSRAFNGEL